MQDAALQRLLDRADILDLVNAVGRAVDARDWAACRAAFDKEVRVDYGTPETLEASVLVERWRTLLEPLDLTHHVIGSHGVEVSGDTATCRSAFVVTRLLRGARGGDTSSMGGIYEHTLRRTEAGWRIAGVRMTPRWSSGNAEILTEAAARRRAASA